MRRIWGFLAAGLCALTALFAPAPASAADAAAKPKILVLTHWMGFRHPSLPVAEGVLKAMGEKTGVFEAVCLEGHKQNKNTVDLSMINAEYLKQFAAILFFTQGDPPLTPDQKKAILDFVDNGGGTIAVHCGTDSFYEWPEYGEKISGAYFKTHGPGDKPLTLKVEDPTHPATKMLGAEFTHIDEFYQYRPGSFSRERVRVLLSVDKDKSDLKTQRMNPEEDYPLAWCRLNGKGRSFTTALGHREDVWNSQIFQDHLLGGIKWALGLEAGDATPSAAPKAP